MDKRTFFIEAVKAGAYIRKDWVISIFAVTVLPNINDVKPAMQKITQDDGKEIIRFEDVKIGNEFFHYKLVSVDGDDEGVYFINPEGKAEKIDGVTQRKALFIGGEPLDLELGELPNVFSPQKTCYSEAIVNATIFIFPFGNRVPYMSGSLSPGKIEKAVLALLEETIPDDPSKRKLDRIYVDELPKFGRCMTALSGFAALFAPAASERTVTVDPAVIKRRDELLEQYKDQLHDPAIFALIVKELKEMDEASFKGDPSERFFINKDKMFGINRMKTFIVIGSEAGFGDKSKGDQPITTSLAEKWDVKELPRFADVLRAGSYNRGAQTALGGESVKYFYRVFQNTQVVSKDCGVKYGFPIPVMEGFENKLIGFYPVDANGKTREEAFTGEELKKLVGKTVSIRSPMVCKATKPSYCAICVGKALALTPTGLHIAVSDVGSTFLYAFMGAMHGKALVVARYDFKLAIR